MPETKDLLLRSGMQSDWESLHRNLWSRPEPFRYLFSRPCADEATSQMKTVLYARMHQEVHTEFFVVEKASQEVVGIAGLKELSPGHWTVTDIAIGPAFQGHGYGKQVLQALVSLAFGELGAQSVSYHCFSENTASKALARSCGFQYADAQEAERQKDGHPVTLERYVIFRRNDAP